MSKEIQPAATGKRGRRGNEVYWTHPTKTGIIISRAISAKIAKLDAKRKPHAVAFGSIGHLSQTLIKAIRLGFPKNESGQKGTTLFIKINTKNKVAEGVQIDLDTPINKDKKAPEEFHALIHFDRLLVSKGAIEPPHVTLSIDKETGTATFTQEADIVEGARNEVNDRIYVVVYETIAESCLVRELRKRGESGSTSITIPDRYNRDKLAIYTFATTWEGGKASNSICLQSPGNEGE